jgi:hypothetical protein
MDTLITYSEINLEGTSAVGATCGKMSATVCAYKGGKHVTVHTTTRGLRSIYGRTFHGGFPEALAGYKSAEMKAIIEAARDLIAGDVSFDHTPSNILQFSTN